MNAALFDGIGSAPDDQLTDLPRNPYFLHGLCQSTKVSLRLRPAAPTVSSLAMSGDPSHTVLITL